MAGCIVFQVLGPVEVSAAGTAVALRPQQRRLLGLLLVHANEPLAADELIEALWGGAPSYNAVKRLQVAIGRLRRILPDRRLETVPGGYRLVVEPGELDAQRFARTVDDGLDALAAGDAARAAKLLAGTEALWRGPAYGGLEDEGFTQPEIRRLNELRMDAFEAWTDAELALGRHAAVVGELSARADASPARERLAEQLMLALYRCGRQAEALAAFHRVRTHLTAELGLEPGPALQSLQARILRHDASLRPPSRHHVVRAPSRLGALAAVVVVAACLMATRDPSYGGPLPADAPRACRAARPVGSRHRPRRRACSSSSGSRSSSPRTSATPSSWRSGSGRPRPRSAPWRRVR